MSMTLNQYQNAAKETAIYPVHEAKYYLMLKLCSEAGEVADKYAKYLRDGGEYPIHKIVAELGDCLWYIAMLAEEHGYDLGAVAHLNLSKLQDRKERGVLGGSGDTR